MSAWPPARRVARFALRALSAFVLLALIIALALVLDARRTPTAPPEYVALGSSYAAGAGLGPRQSGSPILCSRSNEGYPPRVARALGLQLVDMTCSGSVTKHLLTGGQFFQDKQIRTIGPQTKLVTVTVGGNDIDFVRDLYLLATRRSDTLLGGMVRKLWSGPPNVNERNFRKLQRDLTVLVGTIRTRAPSATIILATYPTVLPRSGTCEELGLSGDEATVMRQVESQLAAVTRAAAKGSGALIVDMNEAGVEHHACSPSPWTKGKGPVTQSPFHPTMSGANATAKAIIAAIDNR